MGKPISTQPLTFTELVMRADAETLKRAYEARLQVDTLLAQREEAYRKIAGIEQQIDQIMGEPGAFVYPEPPLPVAGFTVKKPQPPKPHAIPETEAQEADAPVTDSTAEPRKKH